MTICGLVHVGNRVEHGAMAAVVNLSELGHALAFAALVSGALEYAIVIRHRAERRMDLLNETLIRQTSLPALVRITLLDEQMPKPRRPRSLFRSHLFGRGPLLRRQVYVRSRKAPVWVERLTYR
jgi:hypothetical protein